MLKLFYINIFKKSNKTFKKNCLLKKILKLKNFLPRQTTDSIKPKKKSSSYQRYTKTQHFYPPTNVSHSNQSYNRYYMSFSHRTSLAQFSTVAYDWFIPQKHMHNTTLENEINNNIVVYDAT